MEPENHFVFIQISYLNVSTNAKKIPYETDFDKMSVYFSEMLFLPININVKIYLQNPKTGSIYSS